VIVTFRKLGLGVVALVAAAGCASEDVAPKTHDVALGHGRRDAFVLRVDLEKGPPSREPIDVFLLFDTTASMNNVIATVRRSAVEIMGSVRQISSNTAFGVGAFADYRMYSPDGSPWQLHQALTLDTEAAKHAIDRLQLSSGGDLPEAYSRGLYESRFVGWRPDSRRFVILFGDAPAHDPDFYGKNYGVDPGRDGIPGTADDLRFKDVVQQLKDDRIAVVAIYDATRGPANKAALDDAIKGFEYLAHETGGLAKSVKDAGKVPEGIKSGLREAYRRQPRVLIPEEMAAWVTVSESRAIGREGRHFEFDVMLCAPHTAAEGVYHFPLRIVEANRDESSEIGRSQITVRIGLLSYPWKRLVPPLVGLLLVLLLSRVVFRRRGLRSVVRYRCNGQYAAVGRWTVTGVIVLAGIYILWRYGDDSIGDVIARWRRV
jgi:hypothetical protein